ncbi:MAG: DUF4440 domain-containing protein [Gemmatimonadales bacterium]|nr:DUF4440 domain-containing protein [Gemmatimonadales bacterium]
MAIRTYDAAWERKDTATVNRLLADNYRYFNSRGAVRSREWLLAFCASPTYVLEYSRRDELEVAMHGPTAVVSTRWQGSGTYADGVFEDDQRCSQTWVSDDGAWRLLAEQCTNITR